MLICALALASSLASQQPAASPAPRRIATPAATVEIRVTNQSGSPASGAHVTVMGPSVQDANTAADGTVVFRSITPGNYRIRAEQDGLITLEKELSIRAGAPVTTQLALSAAPAPAPPPAPDPPPAPVVAPPPPVPAAVVTGARGEARVLSMTDLAERSLSGRDGVKVVPIGCTGLTASRLIVLRDSLPAAAYDDMDESLYLVAGEATMTVDAKEQSLSPGWFAQIPRGTKFEVVRKGRNPVIFMSLLNGRPCKDAGSDPAP